MAILLNVKDVTVEFPTKKVLDCLTLGVHEGDRIGIVGRNGEGKSSLLSVLSKDTPPDSGEVSYCGSPLLGVLKQADELDGEASIKEVVVGDTPEYVWASDKRTREVIDALIGDLPWEGRVRDLSGGQRRRVDLCRLLIQDWDILMLDEPTNHLDMHAITWLAQHLATRWQSNVGALLVISHDRWFLDEVATSMWEVHEGQIHPFEGGYSAYILQRVERDRLERVTEQKRQNLARKELAWLSRGARARSSKPKFHLKLAQELIAQESAPRNSLELKRAAMARLGKQVLELVDVSLSFNSNLVLDRINWLVGPGDRYGILGANGAGKSSLLKLMQGSLAPSSGSIKIGKTVHIAFLSQRLDELEEYEDDRVCDLLKRNKSHLLIEGKSVTSAQLLEHLGFESEHLQSLVRDLSGGQKRRLQLLLALITEPNVLILDEPGNDMDIDMLAAMEDMLDSWPGTLLVVSHDRYLMERITDDQFALIDGKLKHMPGGVDEYLEILSGQSGEADLGSSKNASAKRSSFEGRQAKSSSKSSSNNKNNEPDKDPGLSGGEIHLMKKQRSSIEKKIKKLEQQAEALNENMFGIDPTDFLALGNAQKDLQGIKDEISQLEESWLDISVLLEG